MRAPLSFLLVFTISTVRLQDEPEPVVVDVRWTQEEESNLLTEEEHKIAFRDVVLEKTLERLVNVILKNSRGDHSESSLPHEVLLPDPINIPEMKFSRAKSGLFNIEFQATNLQGHGLQSMSIKNLHIIRHVGLHDIRALLQLVTNFELTGNYELTGTGLSFLPLQGNGTLSIKCPNMMITLETFLLNRDATLFLRELDLQLTVDGLDVTLNNLMGDGLMGDVVNSILDSVGEDILFNNRETLSNLVKENVMFHVSKFMEADPY